MASSWRDYRQPDDGPDKSDNSDKSDDSLAASAPIVPIVTNVTGLPSEVRRGLTFLANAPAPRRGDHARWPVVVADALSLAADGWALTALALEWSALDLFGASTDGNPYADGLAAWLAGRKLLALTEHWAVASDGNGSRFFFNRPRDAGAVPLWKLGGGR